MNALGKTRNILVLHQTVTDNLGISRDRGQRGLQLVRHISGKLAARTRGRFLIPILMFQTLQQRQKLGVNRDRFVVLTVSLEHIVGEGRLRRLRMVRLVVRFRVGVGARAENPSAAENAGVSEHPGVPPNLGQPVAVIRGARERVVQVNLFQRRDNQAGLTPRNEERQPEHTQGNAAQNRQPGQSRGIKRADGTRHADDFARRDSPRVIAHILAEGVRITHHDIGAQPGSLASQS